MTTEEGYEKDPLFRKLRGKSENKVGQLSSRYMLRGMCTTMCIICRANIPEREGWCLRPIRSDRSFLKTEVSVMIDNNVFFALNVILAT